MTTTTKSIDDSAAREIVVTRTVDAPRELVWQAMTDPQHVIHWWGPRGFTTTIEEMDVRPGGVWKHTMHGPDGTNYPNKSIFKEVVRPERIVYSHGGGKKGGPGANFEGTWTFEALGPNQTRVTIRLVFDSPEKRDLVAREYGAIEGGRQTLERLSEHLPLMASGEREIITTRVFDAPRPLVFEAWTTREHLGRWFGPRGFRTTTHEFSLEAGGRWRFVMHGPDGKDYDNRMVFSEVTPPERLVYIHGSDRDDDPDAFHVTVTFAEEGPKTRLTMRLVMRSKEQRDGMIKFGAVECGRQTQDRLGEHLLNLGAAAKPFVISRELAAPRDLVFKAWTEREHLMHWWGPRGVTIVSCTNDLRPGGAMHYCMLMGGDHIWGKWVYRDIVRPERLVFSSSFSDENGGTTRHPKMTTWPREMLTTVTFSERGGKTEVTVTWVPLNPTEAERNAFDGGHASMTQGWGGTFERVASYLGTLKP